MLSGLRNQGGLVLYSTTYQALFANFACHNILVDRLARPQAIVLQLPSKTVCAMLISILHEKGERLPLMRIGGLGWPELGIILAILLLVFGTSRLPQVGSSLGRGIRAFKHGVSGTDEIEEEKAETLSENSDGKTN